MAPPGSDGCSATEEVELGSSAVSDAVEKLKNALERASGAQLRIDHARSTAIIQGDERSCVVQCVRYTELMKEAGERGVAELNPKDTFDGVTLLPVPDGTDLRSTGDRVHARLAEEMNYPNAGYFLDGHAAVVLAALPGRQGAPRKAAVFGRSAEARRLVCGLLLEHIEARRAQSVAGGLAEGTAQDLFGVCNPGGRQAHAAPAAASVDTFRLPDRERGVLASRGKPGTPPRPALGYYLASRASGAGISVIGDLVQVFGTAQQKKAVRDYVSWLAFEAESASSGVNPLAAQAYRQQVKHQKLDPSLAGDLTAVQVPEGTWEAFTRRTSAGAFLAPFPSWVREARGACSAVEAEASVLCFKGGAVPSSGLELVLIAGHDATLRDAAALRLVAFVENGRHSGCFTAAGDVKSQAPRGIDTFAVSQGELSVLTQTKVRHLASASGCPAALCRNVLLLKGSKEQRATARAFVATLLRAVNGAFGGADAHVAVAESVSDEALTRILSRVEREHGVFAVHYKLGACFAVHVSARDEAKRAASVAAVAEYAAPHPKKPRKTRPSQT
ncbi:hypothetical protein DIPPA_14147 [Diplonema papillatum]|nr:hypothetical protein DIPPA_14147 [Diplonema papillatum]|eukprot:gene19569-30141_t